MTDNLAHPHNQRKSYALVSSRNDCWLIRCDVGPVLTIDDLPDDVLLAIFDFYVVRFQDLDNTKRRIESWQPLVHVCRRWRFLVFGSPRRLNLQICYEPEKRARESMDVWPALPLLIQGDVLDTSVDNVIAGLEHSDRIFQLDLNCIAISDFENLWTAMQVPFPQLTTLYLTLAPWLYAPALPDLFLGGFAPRLQCFYLHEIPFPGLPKLLLSTTHLVELYLCDIPHSGYISPEAMATCLSMLASLEILQFEFTSPQYYPDIESLRLFPPTRPVLPCLKRFSFIGLNEYLEEFVARIDAPQLYRLATTFFNDTDFDTPEFKQFISRTSILGAYDEAHLIFAGDRVRVRLSQCQPGQFGQRMVDVQILTNRHLLTLTKICTLPLRPLLTMENLFIDADISSPIVWEWDIENTEYLDLLLPFTAVKNLYVPHIFSPRLGLALKDVTGGRTTEILPALQNVLLEKLEPSDRIRGGIAQFVSARQLTNHPVAISVWDTRNLVGDRSCEADD